MLSHVNNLIVTRINFYNKSKMLVKTQISTILFNNKSNTLRNKMALEESIGFS